VSGPALTAELSGGGRVLFTSRAAGNMSSAGGLGSHAGAQNRESLRRRVGALGLARGFQVHGIEVRRVGELVQDSPGNDGLAEADGQATSVRGLGAIVLAADCLPVAIGCEGAVAVVHAGWRGLAGGVLEQGVAAVRELGGAGPIVAALGPCAGACCYEVGPEVHEALGEPGRERATVDLPAIAGRRLAAAGVGEITILGGCTNSDERFYSHRREGAAAGRMAAIAWLS
jgi:YfiH family protein